MTVRLGSTTSDEVLFAAGNEEGVLPVVTPTKRMHGSDVLDDRGRREQFRVRRILASVQKHQRVAGGQDDPRADLRDVVSAAGRLAVSPFRVHDLRIGGVADVDYLAAGVIN